MNGRCKCTYAGYQLSDILVGRDHLKVDVTVRIDLMPENGRNVTSQKIEWEALSLTFNHKGEGEFRAAMAGFLRFIEATSKDMADSYIDAYRALDGEVAA